MVPSFILAMAMIWPFLEAKQQKERQAQVEQPLTRIECQYLYVAAMEQGIGGLSMPPRCVRRGCSDRHSTPVKCASCDRYIHHFCFHQTFIQTKKMDPLPMNMVACTKKCYERAKAGPSR